MEKTAYIQPYPPSQISIDGYLYTYKDSYKKGFCYRFSNRKQCKLTIIIEENDIKKIIEKKRKILNIQLIVNNKLIHVLKIGSKPKVMTKEDMVELAKNLISINNEKPIEFHESNLRENNIF